MAAYHGHQQPAFHAGPDAGHQGGGTVGASSAAHPPPLVEAGIVHGGGAPAASQQATAMVVDSAPMKAPEQPKEAVPSTSEPKGNMLEIQESSEKGAQKNKGKPNSYCCRTKGHTIHECTVVLCCEICY